MECDEPVIDLKLLGDKISSNRGFVLLTKLITHISTQRPVKASTDSWTENWKPRILKNRLSKMTEKKNQNYVRILIHQRCFANPKTERSRLAKRRLKNWSGKVQKWKKANPLSPRTITLSKLLLRIDMFHSFLYLTLFFGFKKAKKRQVRSTILQIKSFLFF